MAGPLGQALPTATHPNSRKEGEVLELRSQTQPDAEDLQESGPAEPEIPVTEPETNVKMAEAELEPISKWEQTSDNSTNASPPITTTATNKDAPPTPKADKRRHLPIPLPDASPDVALQGLHGYSQRCHGFKPEIYRCHQRRCQPDKLQHSKRD